MKNIRKILIFSVLLFSIGNIHFLSAQVTCTASAPPQVAVGQTFTFTFALNQRAQQIAQLQFPGFDILSGPNQSSSTSMTVVNGQTTQSSSFSYSYTLRAQKEGNFTIPAAVFVVDGNQVKSNSVQIKVVASQQSGTPQQQQQTGRYQQNQAQAQTFDKNEVFVRAYASKSNPYQGEQVVITHKLYAVINLRKHKRNSDIICVCKLAVCIAVQKIPANHNKADYNKGQYHKQVPSGFDHIRQKLVLLKLVHYLFHNARQKHSRNCR